MKLNRGDIAVLTGASRGLGIHIARALAKKGVSLVLAARSESGLRKVAEELQSLGVEVLTLVTDVADASALQSLVDAATKRFGRIDLLVNNAGFTYTLPYDKTEINDIQSTVAVNLTAPMLLTRLVLPGMIANGRGHIVNIASLAGILPSPYEELYTATKHGLVGFTRSFRASAQDQGWPVSASAVCPGFMDDAGIYEDLKKNYGVKAPSSVGSMSASLVGEAVIRAVEKDLPDLIVTKSPARIGAALVAVVPKFFESMSARLGTAAIFRQIAKAHVDERSGTGASR